MPDAAPLEPGDPERLGAYELTGRLGSGGQGTVYLGRGPGGEPAAVKLLHAQLKADTAARARFAREVEAAQRVAAFCTARILSHDLHGDQPYIVTEYIDGPSLQDAVKRDGPYAGKELERLAIGTTAALAAIHESGVVHRDFKPHNVLLGSDGPRVVDFGVARGRDSQMGTVTATGMVVGTPGYLAPEQLSEGQLGPAVDVFAWGSTMIYAASGQAAFDGDTLPVIINKILNSEPDLGSLQGLMHDLVAACMRKDPAERPGARDILLRLLGHDVPLGGAQAPRPVSNAVLTQAAGIAAQLPAPPPMPPPVRPAVRAGPPAAPPAAPPPTGPPRVPAYGAAPPRNAPPPQVPGYGAAPPGSTPPHPMPVGPRFTGAQRPHVGPPQHVPPPTDDSDSSRGALIGLLIFIIALVIVGVIILIALAVEGSRNEEGGAAADSRSGASAAPGFTGGSGSGSTTGANVKIPRELGGVWRGTVVHDEKRTQVVMSLVGGTGSASARYTSLDCIAIFKPVEASPNRVVLREDIAKSASVCGRPGYVTATLTAGSLDYGYSTNQRDRPIRWDSLSK
jgi:hypothetical protein